jgi:hypothetical protein
MVDASREQGQSGGFRHANNPLSVSNLCDGETGRDSDAAVA